MLDIKILAAVFATLTAMGGFMNGGVDLSDQGEIGVPELPRSIGAFTGLITDSSQDTPVHINVTADMTETSLEVDARHVRASNLSTIKISKDRTLRSEGDIVLEDFKGTVRSGEELEVKGTAKGISGENFGLEGNFKIDTSRKSSRVQLSGVNKSSFRLNGAQGTVSSENASTTLSQSSTIDVKRFSGNISVETGPGRITAEGVASRVDAGEVTYN